MSTEFDLTELQRIKRVIVTQFLPEDLPSSYPLDTLFKDGALREGSVSDYAESFGNIFSAELCFCGVATGFEEYLTEAFERALERNARSKDIIQDAPGLSDSPEVVVMAAAILHSKDLLEHGSSITGAWVAHDKLEVLCDIYGMIKHGYLLGEICCCRFIPSNVWGF